MNSQHTNTQRSWRPDPGEYDTSKAHLAERGHAMTAYLRAALRWLNHDPDAALAALGPFWPDTKHGRPRTQPEPAQHDASHHDDADRGRH